MTDLCIVYPHRVDNCKFMDSAMKPLWLEWNNGDRFGPDIKIIFKNGDGKCV